jgi:molecular chaperone GrpE (heat shock protein)
MRTLAESENLRKRTVKEIDQAKNIAIFLLWEI